MKIKRHVARDLLVFLAEYGRLSMEDEIDILKVLLRTKELSTDTEIITYDPLVTERQDYIVISGLSEEKMCDIIHAISRIENRK